MNKCLTCYLQCHYTTLHGLVEMRDALRNLLDTPEDEG